MHAISFTLTGETTGAEVSGKSGLLVSVRGKIQKTFAVLKKSKGKGYDRKGGLGRGGGGWGGGGERGGDRGSVGGGGEGG